MKKTLLKQLKAQQKKLVQGFEPELTQRSVDNRIHMNLGYGFVKNNFSPEDAVYEFFDLDTKLRRKTILQEVGRLWVYLNKWADDNELIKEAMIHNLQFIVSNKITTQKAIKFLRENRGAVRRVDKLTGATMNIYTAINNQALTEEELVIVMQRVNDLIS